MEDLLDGRPAQAGAEGAEQVDALAGRQVEGGDPQRQQAAAEFGVGVVEDEGVGDAVDGADRVVEGGGETGGGGQGPAAGDGQAAAVGLVCLAGGTNDAEAGAVAVEVGSVGVGEGSLGGGAGELSAQVVAFPADGPQQPAHGAEKGGEPPPLLLTAGECGLDAREDAGAVGQRDGGARGEPVGQRQREHGAAPYAEGDGGAGRDVLAGLEDVQRPGGDAEPDGVQLEVVRGDGRAPHHERKPVGAAGEGRGEPRGHVGGGEPGRVGRDGPGCRGGLGGAGAHRPTTSMLLRAASAAKTAISVGPMARDSPTAASTVPSW
ncbi:hypothetical protein [Streptomyces venezuelae]|uniref:hypothetical protein n=1 Tax=Streptomyces venezuelae TaxID=54571 RepID=UPI0012393CE2|nr:hypothetical protein [Streptomyces venezuelae]